jgi:predicted GNAT family N-acyltransferase
MIKFIETKDVLALRNLVLREGKLRDEECVFENDDQEETFHLGYFDQDELVCIASFHKQSHPDFSGEAYQLRGMATAENFRGKGLGNMLLNFAIVYLRGRKINYLWCNARKIAWKFYLGLGFEFISPEFDIEGIGPHKTMYLKIQ